MRKLLKKSVRLISAAVIFFTFFAYVCPQVNPATFPYLVHFGTAFSYFLVTNLLFAIFWAWRWERIALYHILILAAGWHYVTSFIGTHPSTSPAPNRSIVVGTHNIGGLMAHFKAKYNKRDSVVAVYSDFWKKNGTPDVLCLQEAGKAYQDLIQKGLDYPHKFRLKRTTGILSKYPMESGGEVLLDSKGNSTIWVNINVNGQTFRIYDVHLESNHVTTQTEQVLEDKEFDNKKTWSKVLGLLKKVGFHTEKRARQAELIRAHMDACPHPIIICGDFNDTPNSYVYAVLSNGLVDIFKEKGFGIGSTMSKVLPLLKIDYVLHSPSLQPVSSKILPEIYSDHYAQMARIGY